MSLLLNLRGTISAITVSYNVLNRNAVQLKRIVVPANAGIQRFWSDDTGPPLLRGDAIPVK